MLALTVRAPKAAEIVAGTKRIENRSWRPRALERIAIHEGGPGGGVIGTVGLLGVVTPEEALALMPSQAEHISGPLCWILIEPRAIARVLCPGRLRLWQAPATVQ